MRVQCPACSVLARALVPRAAAAFRPALRLSLRPLLALLCLAVFAISPSIVEGTNSHSPLPPACPDGWSREGEIRHFTKDTLYEHINGEAELFHPFGFEDLATASYLPRSDSPVAVVADVYRMGSVLNSFGIYSNYRNPDDRIVPVGAEGSSNPAQMLFYQDRYFVRISVSGTSETDEKTLVACAKIISDRLPGPPAAPEEFGLFPARGVLAGSERYSATSLFGYAFFRAGLTADVRIDGQRAKAFVVIEESSEAVRKTINSYDSYLKESGRVSGLDRIEGTEALSAADPLYAQVIILPKGPHIFGLARLADKSAGLRYLTEWAAQLRTP